jgi:hypothetical protein
MFAPFLPEPLTRSTRRHVKESPEDQIPVFRRTASGLVELGGSILRYSTTTGEPEHAAQPKPKRGKARAAIAEIHKAATA